MGGHSGRCPGRPVGRWCLPLYIRGILPSPQCANDCLGSRGNARDLPGHSRCHLGVGGIHDSSRWITENSSRWRDSGLVCSVISRSSMETVLYIAEVVLVIYGT